MNRLSDILGSQFFFRPAADNEIRVDCPFCGDRKQHLYINKTTGAWICFRCGQSGHDTKFTKFKNPYQRQSQETAVAILLRKLFPEPPMEKKPGMVLPGWSKELRGSATLEYLNRRGISSEKVQEYKLLTTNDDKYVLVPFYENGKLVYYQLRSTDGPGKLNPSKHASNGFGKSDFLFGYDNAKDTGELVIVEGWADAIISGSDSVAINGKMLSRRQAKKIIELKPSRITLMLDGDDNTINQAMIAGKVLHEMSDGHLNIRLADLSSTGKDPADLGFERCREAISSAINFSSAYKLVARNKLLDKHN